MTRADAMLAKLTDSKLWFNFDFLDEYWKFHLTEQSR